MSYRGRYQQGDYVPLLCWTKNASGVPLVPDNVPLVELWSPTGAKVSVVAMPVLDRYHAAGLFFYALRLSADFFTMGNWQAVYRWVMGTFSGVEVDTFELVDGGNPDGNVIAAYSFERPWANFIVEELDSGRLVAGRNPTIQPATSPIGYIYYGASSNAELTSAQIVALTGTLLTSITGTYTIAAAGYKYFCVPTVLKPPASFIDPTTGFNIPVANGSDDQAYTSQVNGLSYAPVNVTDGQGTRAYRVFRSKYLLNGSVTLKVSS